MSDPIAPLLLRVAAQDRLAFRALYSQAAPKLFGVLMRMLNNRHEAEDALQEVFTRIWLRATQFDPARGVAEAWLVTIARHHALDRLRARPLPGDEGLETAADSTPRAETRLIAQGEAARIARCFDRLEPARAAAVRGAYLDGLSYEDLSKRHGIALNTMRSWLRRSLQTLRDCLET